MTEEKRLAVIPATEISPEIRYLRPAPIEIIGYEQAEATINRELASIFDESFDGTIPPEALSSLTKEDVTTAKKLRTYINNRATGIDNKRKEVKNAVLEPVSAFEVQANRLRDIYKKKSELLKKYIDEAEGYFRSDLRGRLREYWDGLSILSIALDYERIEETDWIKLSYGEKKAEEAMLAKAKKIAGDIEAIDASCGDWIDQAKVVYIDSLDLSAALAESRRLEAVAERTRQMDEERKANEAWEAEQRAIAEQATATAQPKPEPEPSVETKAEPELSVVFPKESVLTFSLRFGGYVIELNAFKAELKELLRKHPDITYQDITYQQI